MKLMAHCNSKKIFKKNKFTGVPTYIRNGLKKFPLIHIKFTKYNIRSGQKKIATVCANINIFLYLFKS